MIKKKVLLFAALLATLVFALSITAFAAGETVQFRVQTDNGIVNKTATVEDVFAVSNGLITSIKNKVGIYSADQIIEVSIPSGIQRVEIVDSFPNVKSVIIDELCIAEIKIPGLTGLESITVFGNEHSIKFLGGCVTTAPLKEIVFDSNKLQVTFEEGAFKGVSALEKVVFCSGGSKESCKYIFNKECFANTGLRSLELIDDASFAVNGDGVFSGCTKLESVYVGNGFTKLEKTIFSNCNSLQTVYATTVEEIKDSTFKISSGTDNAVLKVYVHTEKQVALGQSAFDGRKTSGVVVCVLNTTTLSLKNCKYELHVGVQHKYYAASDKNACYITYYTDCPCGEVYNAYYKLYEANKSAQNITIAMTENPDGKHLFTSAYEIKYENGIDKPGVVLFECAVCGNDEGIERVATPIVTFLGYSVAEFGESKSLMSGVRYDCSALEYYENALGTSIDFGMVIASSVALDGNNPLKGDGSAYSNKVVVLDMASKNEYESTFVISGLKDSMLDNEFIMAAYVIIGKEIKYFQGDGAIKQPVGVSYSQIAE